jgi:hypothetical protein
LAALPQLSASPSAITAARVALPHAWSSDESGEDRDVVVRHRGRQRESISGRRRPGVSRLAHASSATGAATGWSAGPRGAPPVPQLAHDGDDQQQYGDDGDPLR